MQRGKKLLLVLMSLAMISTSFIYTVPEETADARTIAQVENDITDCQKLITSLQNEQKSIAVDISKISGQSQVTTDMLNTYIKEIDSLDAEIDLTQATIDTYNVKISDLDADIQIKNEDLEYYNKQYDSIVRYSFEQGDASIFQILFESEDFSDFLTRLDNINYFLSYTDTIKTSVKKAKSELETAQDKQKTTKAELDKYASDLEAKKAAAAKKKTEFETKAKSLGVSLKGMQGSYSSKSTAITQANAKLAALKKELTALQAATSANYTWPLQAGVRYRISDEYGNRPNPFNPKRTEFHKGIDIACDYGTQILAANGGTVIKSEYGGGYGNVIVILHAGGISTLYGHCSKRVVSVGDVVKQGQLIGLVGSTGSSTRNHLHYSVLKNGEYTNPRPHYIPKSKIDQGK
jgi:murein DD-endopeptidase MepM/ murein hydrolase activator NlpD